MKNRVRHSRIEICGIIGAGKSTIARTLARGGAQAVLEDFANNPFLTSFYSAPSEFAFETEVTFLMAHYHALKSLEPDDAVVACDFSFVLDRAFSRVILTPAEQVPFQALVTFVEGQVSPPTLVVHARCSPLGALDRIRHRGRDFELSVTAEYLGTLASAIDKEIASFRDAGGRILEVDTEAVDLIGDTRAQDTVVREIMATVAQ